VNPGLLVFHPFSLLLVDQLLSFHQLVGLLSFPLQSEDHLSFLLQLAPLVALN
jgi:hypothetical protein